MKSTIKIDIDTDDSPVIKIKAVTSSQDLRDKSLVSLLKKLGFIHGDWEQSATLGINYTGWGGCSGLNQGDGETYDEYTIYPINQSAKKIEKVAE